MKNQKKILSLLFLMAGCTDKTVEQRSSVRPSVLSQRLTFLDNMNNIFPRNFSWKKVVSMLQAGDLQGALDYNNKALNENEKCAALHFLNGVIYEEMACKGALEKEKMAYYGYGMAASLDKNQWFYAYIYGNYALSCKKYIEAQEALSHASILKPKDGNIMYALAYASYYAMDLAVANVAIKKAMDLCPSNPEIFRAAAIIFSACKETSGAAKALSQYKRLCKKTDNAQEIMYLKERMKSWESAHHRSGIKKVYSDPEMDPNDPAYMPSFVFECCIISMVEGDNTVRGINILTNATASASTKYSLNKDETIESVPVQSWKKDNFARDTFTKVESINALTLAQGFTEYSMNIANARGKIAELVAQPVLSTVLGKPAYFINGDVYSATQNSSTGSSVVNLDAGVKVEILPTGIDQDGFVDMNITMTNTAFLEEPNRNKSLKDQIITIEKGKVSTKVRGRIGQTIIVSGLHANTRATAKSQTPFLSSIPFIKYFTSLDKTVSDQRVILYFITPKLAGSINQECGELMKTSPSAVAKRLSSSAPGFQGLKRHSTLYRIIKYMSSGVLFSDFQSGDLNTPFFGYKSKSLQEKIDSIKTFIYY